MGYQVKEVADLAGVSIRTLHHYDHIGLLKPSSFTEAGYRMYSDRDLERLQQILFFKELDFPLHQIKEILDDPKFDRKHALRMHRELLMKKKERLERIIETVDQTIQSMEGGIPMDKKKMFTSFSMKEIEEHQKKYSEEAKRRYGKERVEDVEKKTSRYSEEKWAAIMGRWKDIYERIAARMDRGPEDPEVQQTLEEYRQLITDNFYECTPEIFRGLGDLYVQDERFTRNIDRYGEGMARFLRDAMHVYCDRINR
ncbi:DNA-binding transcriptional MerR regulator [Melghirimyces profundicolus]|uniref:DNA-binding transcriptional MerR regulator n=1 Tax=Melghirimyces profundicolus TaxID=1242148 RepID=A0A2T6C8F4_9BACL|nr:MerR family transcriptional regulator [Melghirimyces profundicolus]PTX64592.1 DNA-binding transcriptional MerR regulator [Melghirimyces profundicolus]